jgi:cytochrome c biogenesis protein ResB
VFHWALLALIVTIPLGTMFRSSGQMGLAVGQAKADEPASYGVLSAGPLSGLFKFPRTIRVDAFDVNYAFGGVVRGPTPTVSILDAQGAVVATQRVYPNNTLSVGTLTIYPADYGFAAGVVLIDANGVESGRSLQLVDFSTTATGGTAPVGYLTIGDASGRPTLKVRVSVPLDRVAGGYAGRLPTDIRALVVVSDVAGTVLLEQPLRPGELLKLPAGGTLKLDSLGYYARLQLVDDPSIPILYVGMLVAMAGLGVATLSRQHIVAATVLQRAEGLTLAVKMRLWRNTTTTRSQIGSELARALGGPDREEPS